jgi:translation initiation factor IF-2
MADKSVQELAKLVNKSVQALREQLVEAGMPDRVATDPVTEDEQERLVAFLKKSHGQTDKKRISLKRKTVTTLKGTGTSGQSRSINVEVRKKKTFEKPDAESIARDAAEREAQRVADVEAAKVKQAEEDKARSESDARQKATLDAMRANFSKSKKTTAESVQVVSKKSAQPVVVKKAKPKPESRASKESDADRKAREAEEARLKELEEKARRQAAEEAQKRTLEEMRQMATKYAGKDAPAVVTKKDDPLAEGLVGDALEESFERERREIKRGSSSTAARGRKRRSSQTEQEIRARSKGLKTSQAGQHGFAKPVERQVYDVQISEEVLVTDLAQRMAVKAREVVKMLMKMGEMVKEDETIDQATAALIVEEMGHNPVLVSDTDAEDRLRDLAGDARTNVETRAPVVTIMGHVDHGKTSLLDKIRSAKVASCEAGGITQHIGAYHVETDRGMITFLDTPGHAAFTAMRSRGAKATDIVVIVVAADDGVMPQTAEAIDHARAAGTPIIVAINKMDKEGADPDKVLNELSVKEIVPEKWGGDTPIAEVSAATGDGIDELLEMIGLQAEIMELTAATDGMAQGVVIESRQEKSRGVIASLLVQKGMLKKGDLVLAGEFYGKVRAMTDEDGKPIKQAGPSIPVEILGLPDAPAAGAEFLVVADEKKAREVAEFRRDRERQSKLDRKSKSRLENLFENLGKAEVQQVNLILKTDVRGSLEALSSALEELNTDEVAVNIISSGVGAISESDVVLAESSEAVLLGFNVRADTTARRKMDADDIDVRYYSVIYDLIDDVKAAMSGKLAPEHREQILGVAGVREVFRSSKFGAAAGCIVDSGTIYRKKPIRVLRDDKVVFSGELESLRRFKDDVNEVKSGLECGLAVKGYRDIQEGDKIEVYEVHEVERTL